MRDLSIQNSMIERKCNGIACKDCPFSIQEFSQLKTFIRLQFHKKQGSYKLTSIWIEFNT
jgi:hypothetical protein